MLPHFPTFSIYFYNIEDTFQCYIACNYFRIFFFIILKTFGIFKAVNMSKVVDSAFIHSLQFYLGALSCMGAASISI